MTAQKGDTPDQRPSTFSFKPALLVGRVHYTLGQDALTCTDNHGVEKWRLDWGDITRATFVELKVKVSRMRRLDLMTGNRAEKQSISYSGGLGDPGADPDGVAQLDLMVAILDRLAARDPAFQVSVGEYGRSRVAMFGVGLATLAGAVVLMALILATGVSQDRMATASVPVCMLVLLGAGLTYAYAPWRDVPQAPASDFADALRLIAHPEGFGR